jgi:Family of unknown function (DUF6152)
MRSRCFGYWSGGLLAFLAAASASGHHGWAGQETAEFELSGTVETALSLAGPHATMQIRDAAGQVWDITLAPPARTSRAGLAEDVIPVGAEVTVSGHRNSDHGRFEIKTERVAYDGKVYDVYPGRS